MNKRKKNYVHRINQSIIMCRNKITQVRFVTQFHFSLNFFNSSFFAIPKTTRIRNFVRDEKKTYKKCSGKLKYTFFFTCFLKAYENITYMLIAVMISSFSKTCKDISAILQINVDKLLNSS